MDAYPQLDPVRVKAHIECPEVGFALGDYQCQCLCPSHARSALADSHDDLQVEISFDTPLEVMSDLRQRMRDYVNENNREWGGGLDMNINQIQNQNMIEIGMSSQDWQCMQHPLTASVICPSVVAMQHKGNWQDWGGRWNRRTKLMRHMKTVLDDLGVSYKLPLQPVQLHVRSGAPPTSFGSGGRRGSNSSGNGNNNGGLRTNVDPRFLSADALGNGAKISAGTFGLSNQTLRRTDG